VYTLLPLWQATRTDTPIWVRERPRVVADRGMKLLGDAAANSVSDQPNSGEAAT